jgi:hypothetical protein
MTPPSTHNWSAPDTVSSIISVGIIAISAFILVRKRCQNPAATTLPLHVQHCRCSNAIRRVSQLSDTDHQILVVLLPPSSNSQTNSNETPAFHEIPNPPTDKIAPEPQRESSSPMGDSLRQLPHVNENKIALSSTGANREPRNTPGRRHTVEGKESSGHGDVGGRNKSRTNIVDPRADEEDRKSARSWLKHRSSSKLLRRR